MPALFDVLTFQMLASVIFPGFTINRWVAFVTFVINATHLESQVWLSLKVVRHGILEAHTRQARRSVGCCNDLGSPGRRLYFEVRSTSRLAAS